MKQNRRPAGGRERGLTRRLARRANASALRFHGGSVGWESQIFKDGEFVASHRFILRDKAIRTGRCATSRNRARRPVTRHEALEVRARDAFHRPSETVADEHSCNTAASPIATGPALTHAGWWSHIFAAALDLSLERRFEPATRPHTAVSADVNVELNACEFAAVGTRTRFVTHHARIDAVLAPPRSNRTFLCASATISPGREVNCVRGVARVGATLTTTKQRS